MPFQDDTKLQVLRATDIVALIEQYVPLLRSGRNYKALCPFHNEKTPSFQVSQERQTFKCFGCGKGGNAIDFLIERDKLDFKNALRLLADRAGIRLPERGRAEGDGGAAAARLDTLELQKLAQQFFRASLEKSAEAAHARAYVERRGISEESSERFGLGYAPRGRTWLLEFLSKRGYRLEQIVRAGLARPADERGPARDFFRGRLLFPIHDVVGKIIGFGGRALDDEQMPKYMNSPETPVFRKGEVIYGLHLAKDAARERGEVAVVEGYTDVILAHQAGFPWFTAPMGTAFGQDQARALARIAPKLLVFFDGDAAGAAANKKTLIEVGRAGLGIFKELRVAGLPDGLDPADLIVRDGPAALAAAVERALSIHAFFRASAGASAADRDRALKELCEVLAALDEGTRRELELKDAAHAFGVPEEVVRREASTARKRLAQKAAAGAARGARADAVNLGNDVASGTPSADAEAPAPLPRPERWALECLLASPALVEDARARLPLEAFADPHARRVAEALYGGRPPAEIEDAAARALAVGIAAGIDQEKDYSLEWRGVVARLRASDCDKDGCTKNDVEELQDSVARKRSRLALQREMGLPAEAARREAPEQGEGLRGVHPRGEGAPPPWTSGASQ